MKGSILRPDHDESQSRRLPQSPLLSRLRPSPLKSPDNDCRSGLAACAQGPSVVGSTASACVPTHSPPSCRTPIALLNANGICIGRPEELCSSAALGINRQCLEDQDGTRRTLPVPGPGEPASPDALMRRTRRRREDRHLVSPSLHCLHAPCSGRSPIPAC